MQTGVFLNNEVVFFLLSLAPHPTPLEFKLTTTGIFFFVSIPSLPVISSKTETSEQGPGAGMKGRLGAEGRDQVSHTAALPGPSEEKLRPCLRLK